MYHRNLIRNTLRYSSIDKRRLKRELGKVVKAGCKPCKGAHLLSAFTWGESPQGFRFWANIYCGEAV